MRADLPDDRDPIAVLSRLVTIDSVNPGLVPGAAGESEIAEWCASWLARNGFEVERIEGRPGRPSIVGVHRGTGGGASILLNGHLDTVGVATYAGDPFAAFARNGRIYGRGTFDMKGGVAAVLVASARAADAGVRGDIIVALVADEEFDSIGTEEVLRRHRADSAVVAEPSQLELTLAHRGFAWFEIELTGQAAHGSLPEQGVDAIVHAGLVLRALDDLRARLDAGRRHPRLGTGTVRVSMISGGEDAATVASSCVLTVERRFLPGEAPAAVEGELRGILDELAATVPRFHFELRRLVARGAFEADPGWPVVEAAARNAERVLGHPPQTRGEPFWTDAGLILEVGIPCLVLGVRGGGAHADEEWVEEESVLDLAEILTGTILDLCR